MTPPGRQRRRLTATETDLGVVHQRALLVGGGNGSAENAEASLDELALLTETAGAEPVERALQRRDTPDPATFIGKGKAEELRVLAEALDLDLVVFDDELSPAQQRNLEKLFKLDVVDRVALILDIFAQHAHSQAGMLQVELAQLRYRLPRLRGRGVEMSRLGAGIGTLVNVFDPELVVLGGGFSSALDLLLEPAREVVAQEALPPGRTSTRIVPAELGPEAGLIGAGLVGFEALEA